MRAPGTGLGPSEKPRERGFSVFSSVLASADALTRRLRQLAEHSYCLNVASEWASATITSPVFRPGALPGTVTNTWIARTVRPAWPVPSEQPAAADAFPSQNCSVRITKPTPGSSTLVFGAGWSRTGGPMTLRPTSLLSPAFEDAPDALAVLFDADRTRSAPTVHPLADGRAQTAVASA